MAVYSYCVIQFIPDLIRNEPVNVGVVVYDRDNNAVFGKTIENFGRFQNIGSTSELKQILSQYQKITNVGNTKFVEIVKNGITNLTFSPIASLMSSSVDEALTKLYSERISIDSTTNNTIRTRAIIRKTLSSHIQQCKLNKKNYVKDYQLDIPKMVPIKFDFMFQNGKMKDAINTISFNGDYNKYVDTAKALSMDCDRFKQKYPDVKYHMVYSDKPDNESESDDTKNILKEYGYSLTPEEKSNQLIEKIYNDIMTV